MTRSVRVVWLCKELQLPHEVKTISFSPEYRNSAEWRKLNPVGKVPAMTDGDFTMFESGAMVQYLLDRYGDGRLEPKRATQAHALLDGRDFVQPDDVKLLAYPTLGHRVIVSPSARVRDIDSAQIVSEAVERVPVPGVRARGGA